MNKYSVTETYTSYEMSTEEVKRAIKHFIEDIYGFCNTVEAVEFFDDGSVRVDTIRDQHREMRDK